MPKAEKLDLARLHKSEYITPKDPKLVEIKPAKYLTAAGTGQPGGEEFQAKIGALYSVAYTLKMTKKAEGKDYVVSRLEGIYKDMQNWKLIIRVPDFITERGLAQALERLKAKGKPLEPGIVQLETIDEGRCVQVLHLGPYNEEDATVARMRSFAESEGLALKGPHHEIYLSDPSRVAPAKLKTILRYPVTSR